MYINSAYLNDSLSNNRNPQNPLSISCCGNYKLITRQYFPTYRPLGRLDYQLIYIAAGSAHFYFDNPDEETIIPAGTFVLFRPKEYQKYIYYGSDHTEVFWIHFFGTSVEAILRKYNIDDATHIFRTGTKFIYSEIYKNIINEIQQKKLGFELIIEAYLKQLLVLISRNKELTNIKPKSYLQKEVTCAQEYFSNNYDKEISIDDYAASRGMSVSWFIRSFKEITGITPLQYILSQRIINAQILLESTDYPINEISNMVGYDNPLYFSRLFRKQKGMSPRKYRDSMK